MKQIHLFLDRDKLIETFEALCSLPFVDQTGQEPGYKREPGIEQLIEQLEEAYKTEVEE